MEAKHGGGPDMMKMLHMMLPYMDPSMKRMISIMVKVRELQELMEPQREKAEQPKEEEAPRPMESGGKAAEEDNLAAQLQEGLTPEQQNMITSLTGMIG